MSGLLHPNYQVLLLRRIAGRNRAAARCPIVIAIGSAEVVPEPRAQSIVVEVERHDDCVALDRGLEPHERAIVAV